MIDLQRIIGITVRSGEDTMIRHISRRNLDFCSFSFRFKGVGVDDKGYGNGAIMLKTQLIC